MHPILAYLDPVTGSALLQVLLAAAAVVGLGYQHVRRWLRNLKNRFLTPKVTSDQESTPTKVR